MAAEAVTAHIGVVKHSPGEGRGSVTIFAGIAAADVSGGFSRGDAAIVAAETATAGFRVHITRDLIPTTRF